MNSAVDEVLERRGGRERHVDAVDDLQALPKGQWPAHVLWLFQQCSGEGVTGRPAEEQETQRGIPRSSVDSQPSGQDIEDSDVAYQPWWRLALG
eukprot:4142729-Amphidinium_carterae.2